MKTENIFFFQTKQILTFSFSLNLSRHYTSFQNAFNRHQKINLVTVCSIIIHLFGNQLRLGLNRHNSFQSQSKIGKSFSDGSYSYLGSGIVGVFGATLETIRYQLCNRNFEAQYNTLRNCDGTLTNLLYSILVVLHIVTVKSKNTEERKNAFEWKIEIRNGIDLCP